MTLQKTRAISTMDGVLAINKPSGMTSHDVVQAVRRITREKRVGHTGTLDPSATGVLVLCLGKATRIARYLEGTDKEYMAVMKIGVITDTQDADGRVIEARSYIPPDRDAILRVIGRFTGEIEQEPPAFSAIKISGVPSYKLARQGLAKPIPSRPVTIHSVELLSYEDPLISFRVRCSKGTYIRTLCTDMGNELGTGAHLSNLVRTRSGRFRLEETITLEQLAYAAKSDNLEQALVSIDSSLSDFPAADLDEGGARRISCGNTVAWQGIHSDSTNARIRVHDPAGNLIAIATAMAGLLRPEVVFAENAK